MDNPFLFLSRSEMIWSGKIWCEIATTICDESKPKKWKWLGRWIDRFCICEWMCLCDDNDCGLIQNGKWARAANRRMCFRILKYDSFSVWFCFDEFRTGLLIGTTNEPSLKFSFSSIFHSILQTSRWFNPTNEIYLFYFA